MNHSVDKLMGRVIVTDLDVRVRLFLYDLMCIQQDTTEEDIATYLNYEAESNPERQRLMVETLKACKLFKAKYVLLKRDLPPTHLIDIEISRIPGQINPHVKIIELNEVNVAGIPGNVQGVDIP